MASIGNIREMFPGGNTAYGFYSFYDYIIGPEANRIFIIKGGPGVGKSTIMRQIGDEMLQRGYDVEFHHCSSDNDSLDGVVIPAIKIALIDGTAPHVVDPKNPGAVDEIIHLGDYWDEKGIRAYKDTIIGHNRQIKHLFDRAYRYLAAAKCLRDNISVSVESCTDKAKVYHLAYDINKALFNDMPISDKVGKQRHLFASAITPDGIVDHLDTLIVPQAHRYVLKADIGSGSSYILLDIAKAAETVGCDVELYHCPLVPDEVEHVIIPALNTAITTSSKFADTCTAAYDLNTCIDNGKLNALKDKISKDRVMMDSLMNEAIINIAAAKKVHDEMESYYKSNMNFEAVQQAKNRLLERILKYSAN
ncbi:PRK06851 family protein [Mahella sp.]|uniref:PRK06851 family protein n=1 Tax=Mahella sp. TaxID=2798721 RepID=UPI0025BC064F|nr:PRK06851 family protein [Mahella sp.]MBZ4666635.1 ATPase [Mahella sp.]